MTSEEASSLREEVRKDIALAMANFKIWILMTVLSNVVLIGIPALYVFFTTTNTAQTSLTMTLDIQKKLEDRGAWISRADNRMALMEQHLHEKSGFVAPRPGPLPR